MTGIFTLEDLRDRGLDDDSIRRHIRAGGLTRVRKGWFATRHADDDVIEAVKRYGSLTCVSALKREGLWVPVGYDGLHVRTGRGHARSDACRHHGPPQPVRAAIDSTAVALACAAGRATIRLTYAMVIHDWPAVLSDIEDFVRADRHRFRTAR